MAKHSDYRRDVYQAIDEIEHPDITVEEIVEFVRWDKCRETRKHYVRDAVRTLTEFGMIKTHTANGSVLINKTDQFYQRLIPNPWARTQQGQVFHA